LYERLFGILSLEKTFQLQASRVSAWFEGNLAIMSFGWSVGDVIAGIGVLIQVFQALDDTKGGKASYSELVRELASLQSALNTIQTLGSQAVLAEAISNCQKCIDAFIARMAKFKGIDKDHGVSRWSFKTFKKKARTVEWAIYKKGEIDDFRKAVLSHTTALISLQLSALRYFPCSSLHLESQY
jgi:hypothetical protein